MDDPIAKIMEKGTHHHKKYYKVDKTSSMTETFPGRLEWKKKHFGNPVTSTPVVVKKKQYEKDAENCFGFGDSDEEDYSTLISPIYKEKRSRPQKVKAVPLNDEAAAVFLVPPSPLKEVKGNENEEIVPNSQIFIKNSQPLSQPDTSSQSSVRLFQELKKSVRKAKTKPTVPKKKIIKEFKQSEEINDPSIPDVINLEEETPKSKKKIHKVTNKKVVATTKTKRVKVTPKTTPVVRRSSRRLQDMFFKTKSKVKEPEPESHTDFKDLLRKYRENDSDKDEDSLSIDPYQIVNTYPSRKRTTMRKKKRNTNEKKSEKTIELDEPVKKKIVKSRKKPKIEEPDPEEVEWIEKTKKEFKRVESVPLLVQNEVTNTTILLE